MKKLTPISFSQSEQEDINSQLGVQELKTGTPKSTDSNKYPVWSVAVGKKVLIYVPNHTEQDADGIDRLRMDKPFIHAMTMGKRFPTYRCINGIVMEKHGLSGSCPLCEGSKEPWDLANLIIEQKCKAEGLDPADTENKAVKNIRSAAFSDRLLKDAQKHVTFPIVVFDTVNDDAKTFVKDAEGNISYKIYWYDCSESVWEDKWMKCLESIEDEPSHPGGNFFVLNYIYTTKNNQPQIARDAARAMTISPRTIKGSEKLRAVLDDATAEWTPSLAQQVLYANMIYTEADLEDVANEVLEPTRNLIALYQSKGAAAPDAGFTLEKPEATAEIEDKGATPVDETDLDMVVGDDDEE